MIPFEFVLFAATLLGIMFFSHHHYKVAFTGLATILVYKLFWSDISITEHFVHEAPLLLNLLGLLVGFELMAGQFQDSRLAEKASAILPNGWSGAFALLCIIFTLSIFLDNIASAVIGASLASVVFGGKVRVGYLAAIVAASNAGGAGSVIGDTTTTMMWIEGVSWLDVTHAFLPAIVALVVFGVPISIAQHKYHPMARERGVDQGLHDTAPVDYTRVGIVLLMLIGVIAGNVLASLPALGLWVAILITTMIRSPHWHKVPKATLNACFLLALVLSASLMPVEKLYAAAPATVFGLGFISAIFDNIPLTKLALDQGGYDWGWLAYAVGFGGSMMWFGSSAGVAVANDHKELRNTKQFLLQSWWIPVAYVVGFGSLFLLGWHPHAPHK